MEKVIPGTVYNFIEVVGSSADGWEQAVKNAVDTACISLTNLRIAEVLELDATLKDGKVVAYRAKIRLSFKYEIEPETL